MRAKLRLSEVKQHPQPSGEVHEDLKFFAVTASPFDAAGNSEDNTYARWTPSAELKMSITNPALIGTMNSGDEFYVDFIRVGGAVQQDAPTPSSGLNFGDAIAALKEGRLVAREGWNGKGMYLWLLPAAAVKAEWCREPHLKAVAEANGVEIEALGSIRMMTADRKVLTGWLASQTDILAEDWVILPLV